MSIASIMSKKVLVTQEDANLASLRQIFAQSKFQHVPVLNSMHQVVGIVSVKDFYKAFSPVIDSGSEKTAELFVQGRKVRSIMTSPVVTVRPNMSIIAAASLLIDKNISCLVVVDELSRLIGIVSWKDILRLIVQRHHAKRRQEEEE